MSNSYMGMDVGSPESAIYRTAMTYAFAPLMAYDKHYSYEYPYESWLSRSECLWKMGIIKHCGYCDRDNPFDNYVCEGCGAPIHA